MCYDLMPLQGTGVSMHELLVLCLLLGSKKIWTGMVAAGANMLDQRGSPVDMQDQGTSTA